MIQVATGADDFGGFVQLWAKAQLEDPWELVVEGDPWERTKSWGPWYEIGPGFYATKEVGNGVAYAGTSEFSQTIQAPPGP